jgi:cyclopropane-fatty-acyl-phospholipid synthase
VWSDLATAQVRKIERLLDQAGVGEGTRVLEIGTGWGELAIRAAQRGATVHSVTLSKEQQGLARRRIAEAGVADRVTVELKDYREVRGQYDAVVSVEMIEAVGYEYWPTYFRTLDAVLAPGGAVAIQAITMPHDRMLATRNTYTWVHKYIFPGGFPPVDRGDRGRDPHAHDAARGRPALAGRELRADPPLWDERFVANAGQSGGWGSTRSSAGCGTSTWSTPGPASPRATSTCSRSCCVAKGITA